jgi:hypothetical protein
MWMRSGVVFCAMLTIGVPILAQTAPDDPGVQGTAAYNFSWLKPAQGGYGFGSGDNRFNGRISARIVPRIYIGLSFGSWEYYLGGYDPNTGEYPPNLLSAIATSVVISSFAQLYPFRRRIVFVRAGVGYTANRTYYSGEPIGNGAGFDVYLVAATATHASVTGGLGVDLPIRRHFAVTISADYTTVLGDPGGEEARFAVLAGVGLTVH